MFEKFVIMLVQTLVIVVLYSVKTKSLALSKGVAEFMNANTLCSSGYQLADKDLFNSCQPQNCRKKDLKGLEINNTKVEDTTQILWINAYVVRSQVMEYYDAVIFGSVGGVVGLLVIVSVVILFIKRSSILKKFQGNSKQNNLYENNIGLEQQVYRDLTPVREDTNSPYDVIHKNNSPLYENDIGLEQQIYQDLTPGREDTNKPYDEIHNYNTF